MAKVKFKKLKAKEGPFGQVGGNEVWESKDGMWRVSYQANANGRSVLEDMMELLTGDREEGDETALVHMHGDKEVYLILRGDHREAYAKAIPKGYKACEKVYNKLKKDHSSIWSNDNKLDYINKKEMK